MTEPLHMLDLHSDPQRSSIMIRNEDREHLNRLVHRIECDLDDLLRPENVEDMRQGIAGILARCRGALTENEGN